jgi:hypothetical protein
VWLVVCEDGKSNKFSRNSERDLLAANRFMSILALFHFGERE